MPASLLRNGEGHYQLRKVVANEEVPLSGYIISYGPTRWYGQENDNEICLSKSLVELDYGTTVPIDWKPNERLLDAPILPEEQEDISAKGRTSHIIYVEEQTEIQPGTQTSVPVNKSSRGLILVEPT